MVVAMTIWIIVIVPMLMLVWMVVALIAGTVAGMTVVVVVPDCLRLVLGWGFRFWLIAHCAPTWCFRIRNSPYPLGAPPATSCNKVRTQAQ